MAENAGVASREVFALTDEQIVGLEPEVVASERGIPRSADSARNDVGVEGRSGADEGILRDAPLPDGQADGASLRMTGATSREAGRSKDRPLHEQARGAQALRDSGLAGVTVPEWLAERMKDPWHGGEAKEFWDGKQRAEKEAAAYREVFATPEDARALKEIYPGGVGEAKSAAERARTLDEIDAAFYRGDAAARMQLAQRMMAQDPAAFREMVEAGVRLLGQEERVASGPSALLRASEWRVTSERGIPRSADFARNDVGVEGRSGANVEVLRDAKDASLRMTGKSTGEEGRLEALRGSGQAGVPVPQEVVRAYGEFERSANAELEKSVGGAIARAMEQALPNLRSMRASPSQLKASGADAGPLQERLAGAVREEVEAALKSDRELGEQVARILAGKRFDAGARGQVVRLIDARAQQLVPGAVKRVVGTWTQATLAARGKTRNTAGVQVETVQGSAPRMEIRRRETRAESARKEMVRSFEEPPTRHGPRVDYGRWSDEEIVGL